MTKLRFIFETFASEVKKVWIWPQISECRTISWHGKSLKMKRRSLRVAIARIKKVVKRRKQGGLPPCPVLRIARFGTPGNAGVPPAQAEILRQGVCTYM